MAKKQRKSKGSGPKRGHERESDEAALDVVTAAPSPAEPTTERDDDDFFQAASVPDSALRYLVDDDAANAAHGAHDGDDDHDDLFDDDGEPIDLARLKPRPSASRLVLMVAVMAVAGWLVHGYWAEIRYYFAGDQPLDLGNAMDYVMVTGEDGRITRNKDLDLPHNAYVRIRGLPTHQALADTEQNLSRFSLGSADPRIIYQLEGAKIFVEESLEDSQVGEFNRAATTSGDPDKRVVIETLDLEGRLMAFSHDTEGIYAGIRSYYSSKYGVRFCSDLPESEIERARARLGKGGVVLVSDDGGQTFVEGASGTDASLYAVDFLESDGEKGYAVGSGGTLLRTEDGGLSWMPLGFRDPAALFDTSFTPDGAIGIAVGQRGVLARTDDAGATFTRPYPWADRDLRAVTLLPDGKRAVAVGGEGLVLRSEDAGKTWTPAPIVAQPDFHDTVRTPGGALLAAGDSGLLLRSVDDGATWAPMVSEASADLRDLLVAPDGRVIASGKDATVMLSEDDGRTWHSADVRKVSGLALDEDFRAAAIAADGLRGVFVGDDGTLARTTDGARTIELRSHSHATGAVVEGVLAGQPLPRVLASVRQSAGLGDLNGVAWGGERVFAVGRAATFLVSDDGGASWQRRALPLDGSPDLWDVAFVSPERGFIAGEKGLVLTTRNGGQTWERMELASTRTVLRLAPHPDDPGVMLFSGRAGLWGYWKAEKDALYFPESSTDVDLTGIAPRRAGSVADTRAMNVVLVGDGATLLAFDDENDVAQSLWQAGAGRIEAIAVARHRLPVGPGPHAGEHIGLAVGRGGLVFRTVNAGQSFRREHSGTHHDLHAVALSADGMLALIGGDGGALLVDREADGTWSAVQLPVTSGVHALGLDRERADLVLVAAGEVLLRSTDGARTFTEVHRAQAALRALHQDPSTGRWWAVGDAGTVLDSSDDGLTWTTHALPAAADLTALWSGGGEVAAVGAGGQLARSSDGGATWKLTRTGADEALHGLALAPAGEESWAVGATGTLLRSRDMGASWERVTPPTDGDLLGLFAHPDDGRLWLVGDHQSFFLKEPGETWSPRTTVLSDLYQVRFVDAEARVGFAVGDDGTILKTTDGGRTWSERPSNTSARLRDIAFTADGKDGVAIGDAGTLVTTRTFGEGWTRRTPPFGNDLFAVGIVPAAADDEPARVVIAGEDGVLASAPLTGSKALAFELSLSPRTEDLRGLDLQLAGSGAGRVVAVGGRFEDPAMVCENGYLLLPGVTPESHLRYLIMVIVIGGLALFTAINLVRSLVRLARH